MKSKKKININLRLKERGRRDGLKKWVPVIHDPCGTGTGKDCLVKVTARINEGRATQYFRNAREIKGPLSMFGRKGYNYNTSRGRAAQHILHWHQLKSVENEAGCLIYFSSFMMKQSSGIFTFLLKSLLSLYLCVVSYFLSTFPLKSLSSLTFPLKSLPSLHFRLRLLLSPYFSAEISPFPPLF